MLGAALALACFNNVSAQSTRSGFYVDDYSYRYQMNPAIGNSRNFVALPGAGNINLGISGNLHLRDVIYNVDGQTTTFLNPGVTAAELMRNLSDMNRVGGSERINILAGGFKGLGGYNTVTLSARADFGVRVPKAAFSLLKEGITNRTYSISSLGGFATAYAELALGHSHQVNKKLRIGGAMKFIVGAGNISAKMRRADLVLGEDDWNIVSDAEVKASVRGLYYKEKVNKHTGHKYVNDVRVDENHFGPDGYGIAFDLGAVYSPLPDWEFNLAILDLGLIGWNTNRVASTGGVKQFNTDRYTFNVDKDALNSFDREKDKIRDDISALYELEDKGECGSRITGLGATLNAGAEYTLPAYRNLSFGLLNTTRIHGDYSWTEFRLSANFAPVKVLSGSVNMGAGTFGMSFGWLANLHVTGCNFFVGMDHTFGTLAKQGVPLSSNGSVNVGLNVLF